MGFLYWVDLYNDKIYWEQSAYSVAPTQLLRALLMR